MFNSCWNLIWILVFPYKWLLLQTQEYYVMFKYESRWFSVANDFSTTSMSRRFLKYSGIFLLFHDFLLKKKRLLMSWSPESALSGATASVFLYDAVFSIFLWFFSNFSVTAVEFKKMRYVKDYHWRNSGKRWCLFFFLVYSLNIYYSYTDLKLFIQSHGRWLILKYLI